MASEKETQGKRDAAATHQQSEIAAAEKAAAVTGAEAVANAVSKVADQAVAAARAAPGPPLPDLSVSGSPGGKFLIRGDHLGTNGKVTFGGVEAKVTAWGGSRIEGELPASVQSGPVVVHIDSETRKYGYFKK